MNLFPKGKNENKIWKATIITIVTALLVQTVFMLVIAINDIQNKTPRDMYITAPDETYVCYIPPYPYVSCTFERMVGNMTMMAFVNIFINLIFSILPISILLLSLPTIYERLLYKKQRSKIATWSIYLAVFLIATLMMAYLWILGVTM